MHKPTLAKPLVNNNGESQRIVFKFCRIDGWAHAFIGYFSCVASNAGNRIKSPISAANIIPHKSNPKRTVGKNPQNAYKTMLNPRIRLVCVIAVPL
jgi:hypothetical protein